DDGLLVWHGDVCAIHLICPETGDGCGNLIRQDVREGIGGVNARGAERRVLEGRREAVAERVAEQEDPARAHGCFWYLRLFASCSSFVLAKACVPEPSFFATKKR